MLGIDGPWFPISRDLSVVDSSASRLTSPRLSPSGRAIFELEKKCSRTAPGEEGRLHVSQCLQKDALQGASCLGAKAHSRLS